MLTCEGRRLIVDYIWLADLLATKANKAGDASLWHDAARSAAYKGLIDAAGTWRADGGATFNTYATYRIRGAIAEEIRHLNTGRRLESDRRAQAHLDPDDQTPVYGQDRRGDVSIDSPMSPARRTGRLRYNDDEWAGDTNSALESPGADPADIYAARQQTPAAEQVAQLLATLNPQDRRMVRLYYYQRRTLLAIAGIEGVTESAICLRLRVIRRKLRRANRTTTDKENP